MNFGRVEVVRATKWNEKKLEELVKAKYAFVDLIVIDTGPAASEQQRVAFESADVVLVVTDNQWGARTEQAGSVLVAAANALRDERGGERPMVVLVRNRSEAAEDEAVAIPFEPELDRLLLAGSGGRLQTCADELLDRLGLIDEADDAEGPLIVSVVGGKGGCGKSTIALLLACRACERGAKAIVIDMDNQAASFASVLKGAKAEEEETQRLNWSGGSVRRGRRGKEDRS